MGGKGSGRLNKTDSILRKVGKTGDVASNPVPMGEFVLPNHSGFEAHAEADSFIRTDGTSTTTASIPFAEGLSIATDKKITVTGGVDILEVVSFTNSLIIGDSFSNVQVNDPFTLTSGATITGNILATSTGKLQFRDTDIFLQSDVDGKLRIDTDSEIELNATTLDFNGTVQGVAANWTGTSTFSGTTIHANTVTMQDSKNLWFGTGQDKRIWFDGSNWFFSANSFHGTTDATGTGISYAFHDVNAGGDVILRIQNEDSANNNTGAGVLFTGTTATGINDFGAKIWWERGGELKFSVNNADSENEVLTLTKDALMTLKSTGDATFRIYADTDNVSETDNPTLIFLQDGGGIICTLGLEGNSNTAMTGTTANDFYIEAINGAGISVGIANQVYYRTTSTSTIMNSNKVDHDFIVHGDSTDDMIKCDAGTGISTFAGGFTILSSGIPKLPSYTDATRPSASTAGAGAFIFNTDDGAANLSDGTNWLLISGVST